MKRTALLILGMHRSGTSALARVAALRGAALPRHVLPANEGNPGGYWEPERITALNDRILAAYGLAWDDPVAATALSAIDAIDAGFVAEARALVESEYGDAALFVLKDPRCTLLEAFWRHVLESLGIQVAAIAMSRPGREVVASLVRRDGSSATGAALLYVAYGLCVADDRAPRCYLTYRQLLDDWRGTTERIAATCDFQWPGADPETARTIDAFLVAGAGTGQDIVLADDIAGWMDRVWAWLRDASDGHAPPTSSLDAVRAQLDAAMRLPGPLLVDRNLRHAKVESAHLAERDRALQLYRDTDALLQQAIADHATVQARQDGVLAERDRALQVYKDTDALLQQAVADHGALQAQHEAVLAERDRALQVYRETDALLQRAVADHAALQARHDALTAERDAAMRLYRDADAQLHQARELLAARTAEHEHLLQDERDRHAATIADRGSLLQLYQDTDAQLQKTGADYRNLDNAHQDLQAALGAARTDLARTSQELATLLASRSWRITGPMRRAARVARRVLGRNPDPRPPTVRSIAPAEAPGVDAVPGVIATMQSDDAFPRRAHQSLRNFLVDEFGDAAADDVLLRIDRYRLPIQGPETRTAEKVECSADQALAWMARLQQLAQSARIAGPDVEPDVSIVIPVYNQLPFTLACIDALLCHQTRYRFEVLVGDDASSDATAQALTQPVPGVVHVRHVDNLGFVRNCNATAAVARGRHVLFLNNDTQVLPGWLDEIIGTLDADPAIGLSGSKLIFPDGRLQECGAIVWRDGSAWNYGRLADPRRPEFCYLRDVDYVSGASIAVPRALWKELGGFDELFVPAYAEDADLAFRIRARGLRTVVQPLSQLLHFEGVSSGTDTGAGAKAYQVENLRKLHARWAGTLATHRDNADQPELEKERGVARRVLFVDHCTPTPREDAGSLVAMETMQGFIANGCKVTFIPEDNFANMGADTRALQRLGIEAIYHPAYSKMPAFLAGRDDPFDVLFLHRFGVGDAHMAALRKKYPRARVVFLNADMHHLRELREAGLSGDAQAHEQAMRTRERELRVTGQADIALVHSQFEQELLREALPGTATLLFPLVHEPVSVAAPLQGRNGVCFVGGFRHPPNADGIAWFVAEAWPLVRASRPDATLYIVGSHVTDAVRALGSQPGVEVVGFVEDLESFLDRRRVSVAPLRYGAGAKGKVAGSLAQGLPVACTPVAAEGMQLQAGEHVLVSADAEGLARDVLLLLGDDATWQRLSDNGLAYARAVTSRASAHARLRQLLED